MPPCSYLHVVLFLIVLVIQLSICLAGSFHRLSFRSIHPVIGMSLISRNSVHRLPCFLSSSSTTSAAHSPIVRALRPQRPPIQVQVRDIGNQSLAHLLPNLAGNQLARGEHNVVAAHLKQQNKGVPSIGTLPVKFINNTRHTPP